MTFAHVKPGEYSEVYLRFRMGANQGFKRRSPGPRSHHQRHKPSLRTRMDLSASFGVYSFGFYRADVDMMPTSGGEPQHLLCSLV